MDKLYGPLTWKFHGPFTNQNHRLITCQFHGPFTNQNHRLITCPLHGPFPDQRYVPLTCKLNADQIRTSFTDFFLITLITYVSINFMDHSRTKVTDPKNNVTSRCRHRYQNARPCTTFSPCLLHTRLAKRREIQCTHISQDGRKYWQFPGNTGNSQELLGNRFFIHLKILCILINSHTTTFEMQN